MIKNRIDSNILESLSSLASMKEVLVLKIQTKLLRIFQALLKRVSIKNENLIAN